MSRGWPQRPQRYAAAHWRELTSTWPADGDVEAGVARRRRLVLRCSWASLLPLFARFFFTSASGPPARAAAADRVLHRHGAAPSRGVGTARACPRARDGDSVLSAQQPGAACGANNKRVMTTAVAGSAARAAMSPPRQRYAPLENDTDPEAQQQARGGAAALHASRALAAQQVRRDAPLPLRARWFQAASALGCAPESCMTRAVGGVAARRRRRRRVSERGAGSACGQFW